MKEIPAQDLIFLDESGANLQMSPLYGRGYGGERVVKAVPFNRGNSFTMLSAISFTKIEAALYGEWAANGEIFLGFIKKCLCPILHSRHVVIMDNVAFHKVCGVKEAIESTGAKLIYLPPYYDKGHFHQKYPTFLMILEIFWNKYAILYYPCL